MSTALYILGFIVLIGGLAWAASLLGVPTIWITIGVVIVAGLAIISIAGNVRETPPRDTAPRDRTPPDQTR